MTRVVVEGDGDIDVHLLLGDRPPAEVLGAGLRELSGLAQVRPAADCDGSGPGFTVTRRRSTNRKNILRLALPSFEIRTKHDLLKNTELFGLGLLTYERLHACEIQAFLLEEIEKPAGGGQQISVVGLAVSLIVLQIGAIIGEWGSLCQISGQFLGES